MSPIKFGPFELDEKQNELRKHGVKISLNLQSMKALRRLLSQPGTVITRQELQREIWADGTFVDFEHSLNATMSRLRERLGDSAQRAHYIETLPGQGYRFVAKVEIEPLPTTPEESDDAPSLDTAPPARAKQFLRYRYLVAAAALLAVTAAIVLLKAWPEADTPLEPVALLPLRDISQTAGEEYFVNGLTDQLLTELGRFQELEVTSFASSRQYLGTSKSPSQIGQELRVKYLLEGSVVRFGEEIRLNIRLIRCRDGRQLWSNSYDGRFNNSFSLERDIASAVAHEISRKIVKTENTNAKLPEVIPAATLEVYLKGKYFQGKGTKEGLVQSIACFQEAINQTPNDADAYTALGESYSSLATIYASPRDVMPKAREAAEKALNLDRDSAGAHSLLARVENLYDWNWTAAD